MKTKILCWIAYAINYIFTNCTLKAKIVSKLLNIAFTEKENIGHLHPRYIKKINKEKALKYIQKQFPVEFDEQIFKEFINKYNNRFVKSELLDLIKEISQNQDKFYENINNHKFKETFMNFVFRGFENTTYSQYASNLHKSTNSLLKNYTHLSVAEDENMIIAHLDVMGVNKESKKDLRQILNLMLLFPEYIYDYKNIFKIVAYLK